MHPIGIVTDSTADIPEGLQEAYAIEMVPALLIIDGETYEDGRQLSRTEFYNNLPGYQKPPTTATPSPAAFGAAYQRLFDEGAEHILSLHVAASLSGMVTAASQAASEFSGRVHVIDSGQLSLGLGFQVLEAGRAALEGQSLEQVKAVTIEAQRKVRVAALINTLEYLRRSGRVSWLKAGMGDLLRIKQLLGVRDGTIDDLGKTRTFDRALQDLLAIYRSWGKCSRIAVLHTGIPEMASQVCSHLHGQTPEDPLIVEVTTIIGAHIGPGSIGLAALIT